MRRALTMAGIASGLLMLASGAEAFVGTPQRPAIESLTTPAAMCGRTCRSGGRYIPGPPEVCYQQGLEYCGSSRGGGGGGGGGPAVVVPLPGGGGIGIGNVAPRCRTITVTDDWGRTRTTRRCD
jgi:hypothetical protein